MTAPAVFTQGDEDGIVVLLQAHPGPAEKAGVEQAETLCPVGAIHVTRG
jgi:ferredoxin